MVKDREIHLKSVFLLRMRVTNVLIISKREKETVGEKLSALIV